MSSVFRWKGRIVSQKQYNQKLSQQRNGLNNRKRKSPDTPDGIPVNTCKQMKSSYVNDCVEESVKKEPVEESVKEELIEEPLQDSTAETVGDGHVKDNGTDDGDSPEKILADVMGGRRIVDLAFLGDQMWCFHCKEALSLQYISKEVHKGLASILTIRCHKCLLLNEVKTSKSRCGNDRRCERFDVNSKSILGAFNAGLDWLQVDKFLAPLNVPCYGYHTFRRYEKDVRATAKDVAKENCKNATK